MEFPDGLLYTKDHEWVKIEGDVATVGVTDFAQSELGDIVFVELPEEGGTLGVTESFGVAESVKTVSDLYSPLSGDVIEINKELEAAPELVNESPYEKGWMIKLKISDPKERESLLNAADYKKLTK